MQPTVSVIPVPDSPYFYERHSVLSAMHEQLQAQRIVALVGPGGIGKSRLAIAYAKQYSADYRLVTWLPGESALRFEKGLEALATALKGIGYIDREPFFATFAGGAEEDRKAVRHLLAKTPDSLLIIDGLDDPAAIETLHPAELGPHVIITSRSEGVRSVGAQVLEPGRLSDAESREFLLRSSPHPQGDDPLALSLLVGLLQGLPLALGLASACMSSHGMSLREYAQSCLIEQQSVAELPYVTDHADCAALVPCALSLLHVEREHPPSLNLLKLCAFLFADGIPEELFLDPSAETALRLPTQPQSLLASPAPEVSDPQTALLRMLRPLQAHRLLLRDETTGALTMHRTVQEILRRRMTAEERANWVDVAVSRVDQTLKIAGHSAKMRRRLLPTELKLAEWLERVGVSKPSHRSLLQRVASRLIHDYLGQYAQPFLKLAEPPIFVPPLPSAIPQPQPPPAPPALSLLHPPPPARRLSIPPSDPKPKQASFYAQLSKILAGKKTESPERLDFDKELLAVSREDSGAVAHLIHSVLKGWFA